MIANIQVLRFVAAFWVVLLHASPNIPAQCAWLRTLSSAGFFGVDIFFVISGAVMAENTRPLVSGAQTAMRFIALRFSRVYAGWWPFFFLYAIVFRADLAQKNLLGSLILAPIGLLAYLTPVVWTLSLELYFYLVLGAVLGLPRARPSQAVAIWGAVVLAYSSWAYAQKLFTPSRFNDMSLLHSFFFSPLVLEFVAGFLLCNALRQRPSTMVWPWALLSLAMGTLATVYQHTGNLVASGLAGFFHWPERAILLGATACGLVACAILMPPWQGGLSKIMQWLGNASYTLYLGHMLVFQLFYLVLHRTGWIDWAGAFVWYFVSLAVVLISSALHYCFVEHPLHRAARRWIDKAAGPATLSPSPAGATARPPP